MRFFLLILTFMLGACSWSPTYVLRTAADGSTTEALTVGGSVLTKTAYQETEVRRGDIVMVQRVWGKDELGVVRYRVWGEVARASADAIKPLTEGAEAALTD
jgi:hypothetical protein